MTVLGIGGVFFRSRDPLARAEWYRTHIGVHATTEGENGVWRQDAGMTVFAPFDASSEYFASDQPFMLNLRVQGLDDMIARFEEAGIAVERRAEWDTAYGRFVRIEDPEGLPIELWELPA